MLGKIVRADQSQRALERKNRGSPRVNIFPLTEGLESLLAERLTEINLFLLFFSPSSNFVPAAVNISKSGAVFVRKAITPYETRLTKVELQGKRFAYRQAEE